MRILPTPGLEVRKSTISGRGCFATKTFPVGRKIGELLGEAAKIAYAVAVSVEERADVHLVDHGVFVPECVLRRWQVSLLRLLV